MASNKLLSNEETLSCTSQTLVKEIKYDHSLFKYFSNEHTIYLIVYVDDIILTSHSKVMLKDIVTKLNLSFSLKYLGDLDYFYGI